MTLILRATLAVIVVLAVAGAAVWVFGPREPADLTVTFDPAVIGDDPAAYLARTEADVPNLRPGDAKEIVWAYPTSRAKTPLAIVYVHGYSASKHDMRPVPDDVAKALGANLFMTRLSGHGRDGVAMARTNVNEWINDMAEAMAIGRRLGEKVVVISTSTGGTLSMVASSVPGLMSDTAGLVFISPNFGLQDRFAFVLDLPFVREFGPRLFGETRTYEPESPEVSAHWTTSYPTLSLLPLGALLRAARAVDPAAITTPAFFIYSPADTVVDPARTEAVAAAWGGRKEVLQVPVSGDPHNHVIAGRIKSPQTSEEITTRIVDWVKTLPQ